MAILEIQAVSDNLSTLLNSQETLEVLRSQIPHLGTVLAQSIKDPDVLGQMKSAFENFIESGQVWALLIGLFVGYMFRSLTAY